MGLDMYLTASKHINGGWSHVRNQYIHEEGKPVRIEPRKPKPKEAVQFDGILRTLGFGTFEKFNEKYPEGNSITVQLSVGYWRKANAIHQWFVSNVQNGVDDCKEYDVSGSELQRLLDIVTIVLGTVDKGEPVTEVDFLGNKYPSYPNAKLDVDAAKAALATQEGFFFGTYDYDQWYIADLESTRDQLTQILNDPKLQGFDFTYQSSW